MTELLFLSELSLFKRDVDEEGQRAKVCALQIPHDLYLLLSNIINF